MRSNSVSVEPVSGPVGAEIRGIDLASDLAETDVALIRDTLFDRGVVFFRDQSITPDQRQHHRAAALLPRREDPRQVQRVEQRRIHT